MTAWLELESEIESIYEETLTQTKRDFALTREQILMILDRYINKDGSINKSKLRRILEETDGISAAQARGLYEGTEEGMSKAAKATAAFLLANVGAITKAAELDAESAVALKRWADGLNLRDRTKILAGKHSDEIRNIIRRGVYKGETTDALRNKIRDYYDGEEWQIDRIVESEVYNTHRLQFGHTARENGVQWVQFNEYFPASKNRENHECFTYAREDNYGLGAGIFHIDDDKIYSPHPRCTGYLSIPTNLDTEGVTR